MAIFYEKIEEYYEIVKAVDEIMYPGYHMHLLDDASETGIYKSRADNLKALEIQEDWLESTLKGIAAVESKLGRFDRPSPRQICQVCMFLIVA